MGTINRGIMVLPSLGKKTLFQKQLKQKEVEAWLKW
jgi:hypothetical protein